MPVIEMKPVLHDVLKALEEEPFTSMPATQQWLKDCTQAMAEAWTHGGFRNPEFHVLMLNLKDMIAEIKFMGRPN